MHSILRDGLSHSLPHMVRTAAQPCGNSQHVFQTGLQLTATEHGPELLIPCLHLSGSRVTGADHHIFGATDGLWEASSPASEVLLRTILPTPQEKQTGNRELSGATVVTNVSCPPCQRALVFSQNNRKQNLQKDPNIHMLLPREPQEPAILQK